MYSKIKASKHLALTVLFAFSLVALSGCGSIQKLRGKDDAPAANATAQQADITRPPVVVKDTDSKAVETSPDETISFEEWREQRLAEKEEKAQAVAEPDPEAE